MDRMRLRAASQLARLPVMTMVSELLFSAGRSILVLLSSRIYKRADQENLASQLRQSPGLREAPSLRGKARMVQGYRARPEEPTYRGQTGQSPF